MTEVAVVEQLFGPRLALEEWADLPEDVPGELVEGRPVEEEIPDSLDGDRYARRVHGGAGAIREIPGCRGLSLDLDAMWTKVDVLDRR